MGKEPFLFIRLAQALIAAAVAMSVGFPALAEADGKYPTAIASADSSGHEITGKANLLDCAAGLSRQQFCCHPVTPEAQATPTTRPRGLDEPVLVAGYAGSFPRAVNARSAAVAKVPSTLRVPRFLLGNFRS